MSATYRRPWVGKEFSSTKLLILGESHKWSVDERDKPDITIQVIEDVIAGKRIPFFTKAESAVTGRASTETRPSVFWPTVAFANYGQSAVETGGANLVMMKLGRETIADVLNEIRPARMLVLSKAVWDDLSHLQTMDWEPGGEIPCELRKIDTGSLKSKMNKAQVYTCGLPHPASWGFGEGKSWHPFVKIFLSRSPL